MKNRTSSGARFRVAILGAGAIAETHVRVLAGIPDVDLLAICDMHPTKAEAFRRKQEIPAAYSQLATMLSEVRPDIVHLAVSPDAHASTAVTCLDAGAHVFLEKPFCLSSSECAEIAGAATRSGLQVGVNHNMVFHPVCGRVVDAFRSGRLGAVEHLTVGFNFPMPELVRGSYDHWRFQRSANIAFELGVHPLSLVHKFCGRVLEARTVCSAEKQLPSGEIFYGKWQVAMKCERATAYVLLSVSTGFQDIWMHVQGEDGACHADFRRNTVFLSEKRPLLRANDDLRDSLQTAASIACWGLRNYKNYILSSLQREVPYPGQHASMKDSIVAYYAALREGYEPQVGIAEGTAVVQACELVVAPIRRQQSWRLQ